MDRSSTRSPFRALIAMLGVAATTAAVVAVAPGSAQGASSVSVLYLGATTSATGLLQTTAPAAARANRTAMGRRTGWFELRAGGTAGAATPATSAPAPSGSGYLWPDPSLEGATIPAGSWRATITLASSGTVKLTPTVRFYKRTSNGSGFQLIGYTTGSSVTLGSTAKKVTLPSLSGSAVSFATGERLYVDLVAKVTSTCCATAAVVSYDNGGTGESLTIPAHQPTVVPLPATSSPAPAPTTSSPAPAPTTSSPAPAPTTSSPAPAPTTSSPAPVPAGVWVPKPGTSWQWQITGTVDPSLPVQMYDIDLYDAQPAASSYTVAGFGTVTVPQGVNAGIIPTLHARGKVVICYLDSGAWENYRPDQALFPASAIGAATGWSGEKWLDIRRAAWPSFEPLIEARLDLAVRSGCDGVEPDQNNPLGNSPGFPITAADQKAWYLELARIAHARHLSVGMKNGIETTDADTVAAFDWNLNEECNMYSECGALTGFVAAGKAVFQVEYSDEGMSTTAFCAQDNAANFDGLLKTLDLGVWRQSCR